jgi:hypothetical protein
MRTPKVTTSSSTRCATINSEPPITVTVAKAQQISGLGATTIWARISDGSLASVSVGRRRLVLYDSLLRLLTPTDRPAVVPQRRGPGRPRKGVPTETAR